MRTLDQIYWDCECTATCGCQNLEEALAKHPRLKEIRDGASTRYDPNWRSKDLKPGTVSFPGPRPFGHCIVNGRRFYHTAKCQGKQLHDIEVTEQKTSWNKQLNWNS